ncbi:MAG: DUF3306 domain-containing protein [Mesorhizobium sp.]
MSDDGILARWSRRKLAARLEETPAAPEAETDETAAMDDTAVPEPDPPEVEAAEPDEAELVASLPPIEDLTAESDITAFLKKGVPAALKHAALRKVWSLDPQIRDYVGPSEYAWDFNQPGSMAGFGPLDARKAVVGFLSKAARAVDNVMEPAKEAHKRPAAAPAAEEQDAPPEGEPPETAAADSAAATKVAPTDEGATPPVTQEARASSVPAEHTARPRHGTAMPR